MSPPVQLIAVLFLFLSLAAETLAQPSDRAEIMKRFQELTQRMSSGKFDANDAIELQRLGRELGNLSRQPPNQSPISREKQRTTVSKALTSTLCPPKKPLVVGEPLNDVEYDRLRRNLQAKLLRKMGKAAKDVEAIGKQPSLFVSFALAGAMAERQGSAAAYLLLAQLDRAPIDPARIASAASVLSGIGEDRAAFQFLAYAAKRSPSDVFVVNNWGWLHFNSGDIQEARAYFNRNVQGQSGFVPSIEGLGLVEFCSGNKEKAYKLLLKARSNHKTAAGEAAIGSIRQQLTGVVEEPPDGRLFPPPVRVGRSNSRRTPEERIGEPTGPEQGFDISSLPASAFSTSAGSATPRVFPPYPTGNTVEQYAANIETLRTFLESLILTQLEVRRGMQTASMTTPRSASQGAKWIGSNRILVTVPEKYSMGLYLLNEWFEYEYTKIVNEVFADYEMKLSRHQSRHTEQQRACMDRARATCGPESRAGYGDCLTKEQYQCCLQSIERFRSDALQGRQYIDAFWSRAEPVMTRYWLRTGHALANVGDPSMKLRYGYIREFQVLRVYEEMMRRDDPWRALAGGYAKTQCVPPPPPPEQYQVLRRTGYWPDQCNDDDLSVGIGAGALGGKITSGCKTFEVEIKVGVFRLNVERDFERMTETTFIGIAPGWPPGGIGPLSIKPFEASANAGVVFTTSTAPGMIDASAMDIGMQWGQEVRVAHYKAEHEVTVGVASGLKGEISTSNEIAIGDFSVGATNPQPIFEYGTGK